MSLHFIDILIGLSVVLGGLSLIGTLIVHAAGSLLALRGSNLRWGIDTVLRNIKNVDGTPVVNDARDIAEKILQHPLVSGSILKAHGDSLWGKLLGGVAKVPGAGALLARWELAKTLRIEEFVPLMKDLAKRGGTDAWQVNLKTLVDQEESTVGQIGRWFDVTMDRVTERYATRVRIIAVVAAFVLAIAMHVDVIHIFGAVSTDTNLRASLLAAAGPMSQRDLAAEEVDRVRSALARATKTAGVPGAPPAELKSAAEADAWLAKTVPDAAKLDAVRQSLARAMAEVRLETLNSQVKDLALIGSPAWGALDLWPLQKRHDWTDLFDGPDAVPHLLGTLFGGALLSLGAPFWFNLLKSLMNLRPQLAEKEDRERAARG